MSDDAKPAAFVTVTVGTHSFRVAGHKTPGGKWRVDGVWPEQGLPPEIKKYINDRIIRALQAELGLQVIPVDLFAAGLVQE